MATGYWSRLKVGQVKSLTKVFHGSHVERPAGTPTSNTALKLESLYITISQLGRTFDVI